MKRSFVLVAFLIGVLVVTGILFSLLGCHSSDSKEIVIGAIGPLTGDGAIWGIPMKNGIDLAATEINAAGGIKGKKLRVVWEDDQCLPEKGTSAYKRLRDAYGIKYLVGVNCSSVALAIVPQLKSDGVLFVSAGASNPKLSGSSPYFFRTYPSDLFEGGEMARVAWKLGYKNVAIIYGTHQYGIGLKDSFTQEITRLGGTVKITEGFSQGAKDFRTQLTKVAKMKPDAIYLPNYPDEIGRCLKQASELRIKVQFLGNSGVQEKEVLKIAGSAAEGVIYTYAGVNIDNPSSALAAFIKKYKEGFNQSIGIISPNGYDALKIVALGIETAGDNVQAIAAFFRKRLDYEGPTGRIRFDAGGDIAPQYLIMTVRNGEFRKFDTSAAKF
jgi:branched-chain amino acid transport system substrate-binding protein